MERSLLTYIEDKLSDIDAKLWVCEQFINNEQDTDKTKDKLEQSHLTGQKVMLKIIEKMIIEKRITSIK